jgi:transketolase
MEIVSQAHARNLKRFGEDHPEVMVLTADLSESCETGLFRDSFRDRFITCGVSEQNMLSIAGGLAREGFVPFVHTFGVFIYRRALDQIAMSVAYPNLPVKMFGFLPGIMTPGGATHQAIEDVAVMRALPNMTVLDVGDVTEVESVLDLALDVPGPVYVRMLRGEVPRLFPTDEPMRLDAPRVLATGTDVTVVTSSICTEEALRATAAIRAKGVSVGHVHVSTLKPFTPARIADVLNAGKHGVITMENHTVIGGLGSLVAEALVDLGIPRRLRRLGLQDTFAHGASRSYLAREYGMDAPALVREVEDLLGTSLGITNDDLAAVRLEAVHSASKAEAL